MLIRNFDFIPQKALTLFRKRHIIIQNLRSDYMSYISTTEVANRWGVSERRVVQLCSENRVKGAQLIGKTWLIPDIAQRPVDARIRSGKYAQITPYEKPISKLVNTIFEADCLIKMREIPNESIDMILCDLPYGITQNKWDSYIPLPQLWNEYMRIIKPNGVIALTSAGVFTAKLILSNEEYFRYKWVWEKSKPTNFLNAKKQPLRKHEDVCIFYKNQPIYHPQMMQGEAYDKGTRKDQLSGSYGDFKPVRVKSDGMRYPTDIIYCKTAESEGKVYHPTQKPIALGRYLIRTYSNPGDIILDNACGSGSFLVAALQEGRNFIGIEKNENTSLFKKEDIDYIYVCHERLKRAWDNLSDDAKSTIQTSPLIDDLRRE